MKTDRTDGIKNNIMTNSILDRSATVLNVIKKLFIIIMISRLYPKEKNINLCSLRYSLYYTYFKT